MMLHTLLNVSVCVIVSQKISKSACPDVITKEGVFQKLLFWQF